MGDGNDEGIKPVGSEGGDNVLERCREGGGDNIEEIRGGIAALVATGGGDERDAAIIV